MMITSSLVLSAIAATVVRFSRLARFVFLSWRCLSLGGRPPHLAILTPFD